MSSITNINSFINFFSTLESSQRLPIEQLQDLDKTRKNLKKEFLKLDHGKETYLSFKKNIGVLKEQHMALRIAELAKARWKKGEPLPESIAEKKNLTFPKNELSKEKRKDLWLQIEKELIALFSKVDPSILSILEQLLLAHGTNSGILPFLPLPDIEYSLIPTGSLIKFKNKAPMCGELKIGIKEKGVNTIFLSVTAVERLGDLAWKYAQDISNSFKSEKFENVKNIIDNSLGQLSQLNPIKNDHAWIQEILRLMQLKQYRPNEFHHYIQSCKEKITAIKKCISTTYVRLEYLMLEALETPLDELRKAVSSLSEQKKFEEKWEEKGIKLLKGWHILKDQYDFDSFLELISYTTLTHEDLESHIETAITHIIKMKLFGKEELTNISYFPNTYFSLPVWKKLVADSGLKKHLPKEIWEKLYKKSLEPISEFDSHSSPSLLSNNFFSTAYRSVMNLTNLSPFTNQEYKLIVNRVLEVYVREKIERRLNNQLFPLNDQLAQLDHLLTPLSFNFSEKDLELITKPFPILLVSTVCKPQQVLVSGDEFYSRKIPFGKNGINLIFVKKENLAQMQEWIKQHKLDDQITVAEVTPILEASQKLPLYHASFQFEPIQDFFSSRSLSELNLVFNTEVTALYKKPYPNGKFSIFHGLSHATRTAFWALILAKKFHEHDIQIEVSKELLLLFAYLHDSGREGDGPDQKAWEEASAGYGEKIAMKTYPLRAKEIPLLKEAVIGKDDKLSKRVSETKKIIHAADTLEILRCLKSSKEFRPEELWLSGTFSKKEIIELVEHAKTFILLTEDPQIKKWLENCSSPFAALFQILDYACSINPLKFSWLALKAASGIKVFCNPSENQLSQLERGRIETLCKS